MLGQPMRVKVGSSLTIELAPFTKDEAQSFIKDGGMQLHSVTRYMGVRQAFTAEDEEDWYGQIRNRTNGYTWGIWHVDGANRKLIGNTALTNLKEFPFRQATSGSAITDQTYWGKGIASAIHKARTWYSFNQLDLSRIKSEVLLPNIGSKKALEKSGYYVYQLERNAHFADGKYIHHEVLECLNPREDKWLRWWGDDKPSPEATAARKLTIAALNWADENVTLL